MLRYSGSLKSRSIQIPRNICDIFAIGVVDVIHLFGCESTRREVFTEARSEMLQRAILLSTSRNVFEEAAKTRACRNYCN